MLLISGVEHNGWFREVPSCELPQYLCTFWSCKFQKKKGLTDVWRLHYPQAMEYTRTTHSANHVVSSGRTTRWLISQEVLDAQWLASCAHLYGQVPGDHAAAAVELKPPQEPLVGKRSWVFPTYLLGVQEFLERMFGGCIIHKPWNTPWTTVSMDFIVALPQTKHGYNATLTFVDKFTKMAHFVPTTNECDAPETARLFVDHVFRYHGLPREFISDRGSQFTSRFFRELCKIWDIKQCFSTAYHPQSNGQAERMNRVVEDLIRHYVSPTHDDWDEHLPQIEFAINNAHHEGLKSTPFYMNYRRHPSTPLTVQLPTRSMSHPPEREMPKLHKFTQDQLVFLTRARRCLQAAQDRQKYYYDKNVRPVSFAVGQKVLLSTKNINLKHPGSNKLLPRWIGPYTILEQVGAISFKLDLPDTLQRLHPVFHASLLTKYHDKGGYRPLPPILMEDGSLEYEVERILDSARPLLVGPSSCCLLDSPKAPGHMVSQA